MICTAAWVFQRVDSARVTAEGKTTGEIGPGALILLGVEADDTPAHAALMAKKAAELRVFCDEHGKMNRSLLDTGGEVLAVSNFTLCANCRHGRRPEFLGAARPETARPLYELFMQELRRLGVARVEAGLFGAHMQISMMGNGPVTIPLDTRDWLRTAP